MGSPNVVANGSANGPAVAVPASEGSQPSPLTSPLLMDAGCVRNDDDEEARRKVGGVSLHRRHRKIGRGRTVFEGMTSQRRKTIRYTSIVGSCSHFTAILLFQGSDVDNPGLMTVCFVIRMKSCISSKPMKKNVNELTRFECTRPQKFTGKFRRGREG